MSPTAHLPTLLPYLYTPSTVATLSCLLFVHGGSTGNLPDNVSIEDRELRRTSCLPQCWLAEPQVHTAQLFSGFRSKTETVTDLCPFCLSLHHCHFCTFTFLLAQLVIQTVSLTLSCIAACISCVSSPLLTLASPPSSHRGVGRQRGKNSFLKILLLCPPVRSDSPERTGFFILRLHPQLPTGSWGPGSFAP